MKILQFKSKSFLYTAKLLLLMGSLFFVAGVRASPAQLDPSFGTGGIATVSISASLDQAESLIRQPDGKLVVGGYACTNYLTYCRQQDFAMARLNADGSLDTSFSGDGKLTTTISISGYPYDYGFSVIRQQDAKLVMVGSSFVGSPTFQDSAVLRYNVDGSLDTTFSGDGKLTTELGGFAADSANAVLQQTDGKLVTAGYGLPANPAGGGEVAVVRYNIDGSLDTTFSGDGKVNLATIGSIDEGQSIVQQSDGKLVIAGLSGQGTEGGENYIGLFRLNLDGSLDSSFSGDGKLTTSIGSDTGAYSVIQQQDGKLVVAGAAANGPTGSDIVLARYNADGSMDVSFGSGGVVTTDIGTSGEKAYSVIQQVDGKLVVAGFNTNSMILLRYNIDGSLDTTFNDDGKILLNINIWLHVNSIIQQPDGKLVVAGTTCIALATNCVDSNFVVLRYITDPDSDGDGVYDNGDYFPTDANESQDADHDGVGDNSDNCTDVTNPDQLDTDGDLQGDACDAAPNGDNDGDGVDNNSDNCPSDGDLYGYGVDQWGCPISPSDSDVDGYTDNVDACPYQGDQGYGVDSNGCPNVDSDGDGVPDSQDACPNRGEEGYGVDWQGCPNSPPPQDYDGDGYPDYSDACSWEGDTYGYGVDYNGCPIQDSDGDGFADPYDACPYNSDNGYGVDSSGCPLPPPPVAKNDFNKDGIADLLIRSSSTGAWRLVVMSNGFAYSNNPYAAYSSTAWQLAASEDFDGDGDTDMLLRNTSTGAWRMFITDNGAVVSDSAFGAYTNLSWALTAVADFNNDGIKDVLLHDTSSGVWRVFYVTNGSTTTNANMALYSTGWSLQSAKDFDGDGDADIVLRSESEGLWRIFTVQNGVVSGNALLALYSNTGWTLQAVEDLDNDGDADVVMRGSAGDWRVFNIQNNAVVNNAALGLYFNVSWNLDHVNDVNNDGDADFVLRNTSTGDWRLFNIQDRAVSSNTLFGLYVNTAWQTKDEVDINGDGTKDVIMNNSSTGAWRAFMINNGTVTGNTNPGLYQNVDWTLQDK